MSTTDSAAASKATAKTPVHVDLPQATGSDALAVLLKQYGCGPIRFVGPDNGLYDRHLLFDNVVDAKTSGPREKFEAFARSVRDVLSQRWVLTEKTYQQKNAKRIYYLSMEFLIGRSLANNVTNLLVAPFAQQAVQ